MNRTLLLIALVGIVLVTAPSSSGGAQDKPSYPLLCRGTKDIKLAVNSAAGFAMLDFHKGTRPAESGLAPGECSWMDRGIREGEPGSIMQGSSVVSGPFGKTAQKLDWGWTEALKDPDKYWLFHVYTDRGVLIVTDSKPHKKIEVSAPAPPLGPAVTVDKQDDRAVAAETARSSTLELNTNRPGQDYKSFESDADPEVCRRACADDPNCMAFTFVKPGVQGPRAVCWLKSGVPAASKSDCCISGVKPTATSGR